ncbi:uncharacterized protein [Henckelia pumila]|uniref:uncharacterized protein isoform X3 n=1 Tax=Henckelia pumila TaxID=405737 RepID=UPI003C6E751E
MMNTNFLWSGLDLNFEILTPKTSPTKSGPRVWLSPSSYCLVFVISVGFSSSFFGVLVFSFSSLFSDPSDWFLRFQWVFLFSLLVVCLLRINHSLSFVFPSFGLLRALISTGKFIKGYPRGFDASGGASSSGTQLISPRDLEDRWQLRQNCK